MGRYRLDWRNQIYDTGCDGTRRHAVMLRPTPIATLGDRQAAAFLDGLEAKGSVAPGSREHDPNRVFAQLSGEGVEKAIDRAMLPRSILPRHPNAQAAVVQGNDRMWGRHVDDVRLNLIAVVRLCDRHGCPSRKYVPQHTLSAKRQMKQDDESQAAIGSHVLEKTMEGVEPAGGCADSYNAYVGIGHQGNDLLDCADFIKV
jgi:hypothetical protein